MALLKRNDSESNDPKTLIGAGAEFEGKLSFDGAIRIDGKFSGSINKGDLLIVGESATIVAEITCENVVICGTVTGNVRARASVELRQQAKVRGDVETPSLTVEPGARLDGHVKMEMSSAEMPAAGAGASVSPPLVAVNS